jgi:hypothetical protein
MGSENIYRVKKINYVSFSNWGSKCQFQKSVLFVLFLTSKHLDASGKTAFYVVL